jgi:hypothetical protein
VNCSLLTINIYSFFVYETVVVKASRWSLTVKGSLQLHWDNPGPWSNWSMQRMAQVKMHSQCVINADGSAEIRSAGRTAGSNWNMKTER